MKETQIEKELFNTIKNLVPKELIVKSKKVVKKTIRKTTTPIGKTYNTIWCKNRQNESVLVLYDGQKIKMISQEEINTYYEIHNIKS